MNRSAHTKSAKATDLDIAALFREAERSIIRIEQQSAYAADFHTGAYDRWLAGDPMLPTETPGYPEWLQLAKETTGRGVSVTRVRIQADPPTEPQRWAQWKGRWNTGAGDMMRYLSRADAFRVGVLPAVTFDDWWLFDDELLLAYTFDDDGVLVGSTVSTDPEQIAPLLAAWVVAIEHSTPEGDPVAA